MLGAVVNKGVFTFDRPLTVIEAIARAGGLETGLYERDTVELADLGHSFLVRNSQRVPVDFERLFERGDLSQNVPLQPDDYLYFALASANEIYVLGEVISPGVAAFLPQTQRHQRHRRSAADSRARRSSSRVLVVRGSLNHPQTFVVDAADILSAKKPDFKLQAKDIVYVSKNPWVKAAGGGHCRHGVHSGFRSQHHRTGKWGHGSPRPGSNSMKRTTLVCFAGLLLAAACRMQQHRQADEVESGRFLRVWPPTSPTMTVTNQSHPELLRPSEDPFTLGPGDRVEIEMLGTPTPAPSTTVGPDGKIYYYLLPGLDVWG